MGIIHRDIKTENILIDTRENIRIIDFGLACSATSRKPVTDFLGTPPYMAPEVLRNKGRPIHRRRHYGKAVDWWGLGCILFELQSRDHQVEYFVSEPCSLPQETDGPPRSFLTPKRTCMHMLLGIKDHVNLNEHTQGLMASNLSLWIYWRGLIYSFATVA